MKSTIYSVLLLVFFLSCSKQQATTVDTPSAEGEKYQEKSLAYLRGHLADSIYQRLDSGSYQHTIDYPHHFDRFWFQNRLADSRFIQLELDSVDQVVDAVIVQFTRSFTSIETFNGSLEIKELNGHVRFQSTITNGFIDHPALAGQVTTNAKPRTMMEDPIYKELPEVTVYPDPSITDGDYYYLGSGLGYLGGVGYNSGGYGGGVGGGGGTGYGIYTRNAGGGGSPAFRNTANRPASMAVEASYLKPGIDIKTFLNCFSAVTSAGASYSVSLFVDLPVNDDPSQIFNMATGAVGHCFVGLTKINGTQSVTQYVGFTATQAMSAIVAAGPVAGKIVNNGTHKYNGAVVLSVNAAQFNTACNTAAALSKSTYDIVNFNCVSFGLSVVNSMHAMAPIVPTPISNNSSQLFSMPEGLYKTMQQMQASGKPAVTGGVWNAGQSHGSCN